MDKKTPTNFSVLSKIIFISSCVFLSSCMSAVFTGANVAYHHNDIQHSASDYLIVFRIKNGIENDPDLFSQSHISVTSFNQIVLLTGQANTAQLRERAASIAQNTPNVLRVFNAITVGEGLKSTTVAYDTWLTAKIKSQIIASNDLDPAKIKVVTENHVVYLIGIIPKDQADIAVEIARNTAGVGRVVKIFYYVIMPRIG